MYDGPRLNYRKLIVFFVVNILHGLLLSCAIIGSFNIQYFSYITLILIFNILGSPLLAAQPPPSWAIYVIIVHWVAILYILFVPEKEDKDELELKLWK